MKIMLLRKDAWYLFRNVMVQSSVQCNDLIMCNAAGFTLHIQPFRDYDWLGNFPDGPKCFIGLQTKTKWGRSQISFHSEYRDHLTFFAAL
jgi:hypothetical protein